MSKIFIFCLIWFVVSIVSLATKKEGPFKSVLSAVRPCKKTSRPVMKKYPTVTILYDLYYDTSKKLNLGRGNMTVLRDINFFEVEAEGYLWSKGKWRPHITFPGMSCKNPLVRVIVSTWSTIPLSDDCLIRKGFYNVSAVDVNRVVHLWTQKRTYGTALWKIQVNSASNTLFCFAVVEEVIPIKGNNK